MNAHAASSRRARRGLADRRSGEWSRRQFLGAGGAALLAGQALARPGGAHATRSTKVPRRRTAGGAAYDPILLKLLDRTSFGFTRASYAEAEAMGYSAYLEYQLDPLSIDDSALEARLAAYDTLSMTAEESYLAYRDTPDVPVYQLLEATTLRAVLSKRQLFERMVEFWTDHFSIYIRDDLCQFLKTQDDRDVIRQYALSTFPQLLNASAHSGAMMFYLDNYANVVGHAQENYARELMELHTLGVNGGYVQEDVEEVARCLTGWAFETAYRDPVRDWGDFEFRASTHDTGSKVVLGQVIPAGGGESDGQTVLDILAYHPKTAEFIGRKLCKHFLGYDPPEDMAELLKQVYLSTGGDIKELLRALLQPTVVNFQATPKLRRPFHLAMSLLRASEANISNPLALVYYLSLMGHLPYYHVMPDGYPDTLEAWGTSLRPRWQFASALFDGGISGVSVNATTLLQSEGGTAPGLQAEAIDRILTGQRMSPVERQQLQAFYDGLSSGYTYRNSDTFGLGASMPSLQWY